MMSLPHSEILNRTRDTDEHVRKVAYKFLAEKVHIKALTIRQMWHIAFLAAVNVYLFF